MDDMRKQFSFVIADALREQVSTPVNKMVDEISKEISNDNTNAMNTNKAEEISAEIRGKTTDIQQEINDLRCEIFFFLFTMKIYF